MAFRTASRVRTFFQVSARAYDLMTRQNVWRTQIARVVDHVPNPDAVRRVLDLGCGPGVSSFVLAERLPGARVDGIDIAEAMIRAAHRHHSARYSHLDTHFQVADATQLPFDDEGFDVAIGHSFLYLVPDREAVLREVRRVLRPGGRVVLMEPDRGGSLLVAGRRALRYGRGEASTFDAARFGLSMVLWRAVSSGAGQLTHAQARGLFRAAGFERLELVPTLGGLGMHCIAAR